MSQRVAVVTGSNKGIGFGIVAARNEELGLRAMKQLQATNPTARHKLRFHQLDITNVESIKRFADHIQRTHGGLDVLVNNAAIAFKNADPTPFGEQAEITIRTNFFGTMNVCNALFPLLRPHARVVNVSSRAGMLESIRNLEIRRLLASSDTTVQLIADIVNDFIIKAKQNLHQQTGYPKTAYGMSKIALTAATFIQQRLFNNQPDNDIVVNSMCPAADTPVYLATLPPYVKSPRGEFVAERNILKWKC
ncbi:unnamed protein product [Didymodactylos carnosus]|uniref:Carbonyl reductase n=1 Tax=Didymodactylos carnosus TaxID=1234261 RepID=A0A815FGB8_9BILA|nr:unnamed protein product [Didymodactylos carnosus]CAF4173765.1 unnamed protein product [Didymodactylos carnosus]